MPGEAAVPDFSGYTDFRDSDIEEYAEAVMQEAVTNILEGKNYIESKVGQQVRFMSLGASHVVIEAY